MLLFLVMKQNVIKIVKINFALVLTAMVVGLITSLVTQIFALTAKSIFLLIQDSQNINFLQFSFFSFSGSFLPLIACISAGILVGLLIKSQKIDRWHGPADTIYAAHQQAGTLDVKRGFTSTLAAFFSISGGASVGIYGPLVHFGGTLGAFLRRRKFIPTIPHDIIIGAGVAAAISAGFSSPIAGIVFAHEVVLRHFSMRALTAISLSSVTASFTAHEMDLVTPALRFDEIVFDLITALPGLLITGLIASLIAFLFMKSLLFSTKLSNSSNIKFHLRPLIPAALCGFAGIFLPESIGLGTETIVNVITSENTIIFLLMVLIFKLILSSLCIGFGLFGGVFSPALLLGACTGALIFNIPFIGIANDIGPILAVSGMAAVSSSVIGGPITAIILVFELTGSYEYAIASIFPIAICNLITYLIFGSSFFDAQLKARKIPMGHGREHILMSQTIIEKYADKNYLKLDKKIKTDDAIKKFKKYSLTEGYFLDKNENYLGKLRLIDIIDKKDKISFNYNEKNHIKLLPTDNLINTMKKLGKFIGESVPIIDKNNKFIGVISENDVLNAYSNISETIRNIEKN